MKANETNHRKFLPDGAFKSQCGNGHLKQPSGNRASSATLSAASKLGASLSPSTSVCDPHSTLRDFVDGKPGRSAACHAPFQPAAKPHATAYWQAQRRIPAYRFNSSGIHPTHIVEEMEQHFKWAGDRF